MDLSVILVLIFGGGNLALLTAIFFRLGRGAARFDEIYRRVEFVEERVGAIWKHLSGGLTT